MAISILVGNRSDYLPDRNVGLAAEHFAPEPYRA
jgi:hypothetical protein